MYFTSVFPLQKITEVENNWDVVIKHLNTVSWEILW